MYLTIISFLFLTTVASCDNKLPLVMLHGIASSKDNLAVLEGMIKSNFNLEIFNLEIGDGVKDSFELNMNAQLEILCNTIYQNEKLKGGFNFLAMSQGGLLARGYVQYCNLFPVNNLITLATPHGGVFEPNNVIVKLLNIYDKETQNDLSFSNYWRDAFRYDLYLTNSTYLSKLNAELMFDDTINEISNNLDVLNNFVLVWSPFDEVLTPPDSGKFSTYKPNENKELIVEHLFDNIIFKENRLGLRTLFEQNKLIMHATDCKHSEHREPKCFHQLLPIFKLYL
jgi:palmitoyl-protein thioesterase